MAKQGPPAIPLFYAIAVRGSISAWCGNTLHSGLRAQTRQRTHGADHEVLHELRALLTAPRFLLVVAERWDLGRAALALEGAVEARRGVHLGDAAGLHGATACPRNGQRVLSP